MLTPLVVLIMVLGFYPKPVLDVINPSVEAHMIEVGHRPVRATSRVS